MLTIVVEGLRPPAQILGAVEELGRRHSTYGVRPEHDATVGAALLWTLQTSLGEAFSSEPRDAWTGACMFLSSAMQNAAANVETVDVMAVRQHA